MSRLAVSIHRIFPATALSLCFAGILAGCSNTIPRDNYVVFFDRESTELNAVAQDVIKEAADAALKRHAKSVVVSGVAEPEGDSAALKNLKAKRVTLVIHLLEENGVPSSRIVNAAFIPDAFEDSHVAMRRVNIQIGKP